MTSEEDASDQDDHSPERQVNKPPAILESEEDDSDQDDQSSEKPASKPPAIIESEDDDSDQDDQSTEKPASKPPAIIESEEDDSDQDDDSSEKAASKPSAIVSSEEDDSDQDDRSSEKPASKPPAIMTSEEDDSDQDDRSSERQASKPPATMTSEEDDSDRDDRSPERQVSKTVYDFDIMMAKKKGENSHKRRRRGYDIINDNDDIIADIINQMKDAVESDIEAINNEQVATNKLKLLPFLVNQLRKVDLREAFLESDVLSVLTEWLAPLPDRSLPHLNIRESLLKILIDFNLSDVERIKSSGIGKAIMYLYKHPKETKENKQRAKQLISVWSRPIFNLDSSFSAISREEREERDKELQRRASRATVDSSDGETSAGPATKRPRENTTQPVPKNPGDKGWIPRARVPAPSMRDYVIRPRSNIDGDIGKGSKRPSNVLEKLMKTHQERKRANKQQRAVNMKIDKS